MSKDLGYLVIIGMVVVALTGLERCSPAEPDPHIIVNCRL